MAINFITIAIGTMILWLVLALAWIVVWILTLIHQAKRKRWAWFIITLLFQITALIYWFVWMISPSFRKKKRR